MSELYLRHCAISLFKHAAEASAPLAAVFKVRDTEEKLRLCADVFKAVADSGARSTGEWLAGLLERDDNAFSRAAASGARISDTMKKQVEKELATFKLLSRVSPEAFVADIDFLPRFESGGFALTYEKLLAFYLANGCGALAHGDAFAFGDNGFIEITAAPVSLSDIKNYTEEKTELVKNTENFINGLPAFHALLYGDCGTGKSSTVRGTIARFKGKLKMIELDSRRLELLPELLTRLSEYSQKFIVFIDGIAAGATDVGADVLKTALETSVGGARNALIYCTSDRHRSDKAALENNALDTLEERALFDRFGLVITYLSPDRDEFLDIFRQIVCSRGIKWRDEYSSIAELAALKKGGRTPRAARQIADLIQSAYAEMR